MLRTAHQYRGEAGLVRVEVVGEEIDGGGGIFGQGPCIVGGLRRGLQSAEVQVADGEVAVLRVQPLAEADEVEGEVDHRSGSDAGEVDEVGAACCLAASSFRSPNAAFCDFVIC